MQPVHRDVRYNSRGFLTSVTGSVSKNLQKTSHLSTRAMTALRAVRPIHQAARPSSVHPGIARAHGHGNTRFRRTLHVVCQLRAKAVARGKLRQSGGLPWRTGPVKRKRTESVTVSSSPPRRFFRAPLRRSNRCIAQFVGVGRGRREQAPAPIAPTRWLPPASAASRSQPYPLPARRRAPFCRYCP